MFSLQIGKVFTRMTHIASTDRPLQQIWRGWYSNIALNWTWDQVSAADMRGCQMHEYVTTACNILIYVSLRVRCRICFNSFSSVFLKDDELHHRDNKFYRLCVAKHSRESVRFLSGLNTSAFRTIISSRSYFPACFYPINMILIIVKSIPAARMYTRDRGVVTGNVC